MNGGLSLLGKAMIVFGVLTALAGAAIWLIGRAGGRLLPGDVYVKRENITFFFPIVSCLVASLVATLLLWLFFRVRR